MQLVEQHVIDRKDPRYSVIDEAAFKSKNLYNKASFLDLDPLPVRKSGDEATYTFSGKRVKRGLYSASNGREINADINGAYNM